MTDLEMTKLCAKAMGLKLDADGDYISWGSPVKYDPLHDDAQAMALVKHFRLDISGDVRPEPESEPIWVVASPNLFPDADGEDLNRAIVECVAKMQSAKAPQS